MIDENKMNQTSCGRISGVIVNVLLNCPFFLIGNPRFDLNVAT